MLQGRGGLPWKVNDAVDCGDRLLGLGAGQVDGAQKDKTELQWIVRGKEGTVTIINVSRAHMSAPGHVLAWSVSGVCLSI